MCELKIGTLNVQGGNQTTKKQNLADDTRDYQCDAILITETRIKGTQAEIHNNNKVWIHEENIRTTDGASSGIGAATAVLFSKLGASLVLTGRKEVNLAKVGDECAKNSSSKPFLITGDLTKEDDCQRIVDETVKHFGKLHILVNNAGVLEMGSIENTSMEQYDRVFAANVRSVYHLTMLCTPHLVATKGNIVMVSSVNGTRSFPGVLAYCMSKASVDQMTRCVALELAPKQVRCNCVNPGVIVTELQKRGGLTDEAYAAFLERSKTTHALGRPGEPDEVARTIAFLASDDASFMTGATLPVDGGRHAMCPR